MASRAVSRQVGVGPGTLRVGRFIGRLGVVSLPAVQAGLDLDQRVIRRHVAKLEAAGWLARAPWVWGEGSVAWLTRAGVQAAGLGGMPAIKSPPAPTTIAHGVLVGWSAARNEHRRREWKSARELAVDHDRWAVRMRRERGYASELPDLAVWLPHSEVPGAVIAESGYRREDRQKMILEGWRDAISSGTYSAVRYDCTSPSVAQRITRLATKVGLTRSFGAHAQTTAEQIAALTPAAPASQPAVQAPEPPADMVQITREPTLSQIHMAQSAELPPASVPEAAPTFELAEAESTAERERLIRELLGTDEPKRRRRWHR